MRMTIWLRPVLILASAGSLMAAQPTLTTIAPLAGGTEDEPYIITYDAVKAASDASLDTTRFKVDTIIKGSIETRAHGSSDAWVAAGAPPFYLDASVDLRWMPPANLFNGQAVALVYANNGTTDSTNWAFIQVQLANTFDPLTATSGANRRTLAPDNRLVGVDEDTWAEFTYADLKTLFDEPDTDQAGVEFVITGTINGQVAKSSGGTALAAGARIGPGESLWWLPPQDVWTEQGATPAEDAAPIQVASFKAEKTQSGTTYRSDVIALTSTVDAVADPFDMTATTFTPIRIVRGQAVTLSGLDLLARITDFSNPDRNANATLWIDGTTIRVQSWDASDTPDGDSSVSQVVMADSDHTVRFTVPADAHTGTVVIGTVTLFPNGTHTAPSGATVDVKITVTAGSSSGDGSGGGSGGGCGGGGLGTGLLIAFLCVPLRRSGRRL